MLGGHSSVRGYRESTFSGDNGVLASLEWRLPVYSRDNASAGFLMLASFFSILVMCGVINLPMNQSRSQALAWVCFGASVVMHN